MVLPAIEMVFISSESTRKYSPTATPSLVTDCNVIEVCSAVTGLRRVVLPASLVFVPVSPEITIAAPAPWTMAFNEKLTVLVLVSFITVEL
jgi:hypothetical protein